MKSSKKILIMLVATLLMATKVLAGEITIIKKVNGTVTADAGTVEYIKSEAGGLDTLKVTPASGYYIESITAEKTVSGDLAQSRPEKAPDIAENLTVTSTNPTADPSGVTKWTFTMPGGNYDVEVVANFQTRTDISGATVTLALESFNYDGVAKEPAVNSVVLGSETIDEANYTVSYSNNTDAGTATVTVTGKNTYTGTATTTFTINKAALNLEVTMDGWIYGQYNEEVNAPRVEGNEGEGAETVSYKVKGAGDDTYTTKRPTDAGDYIVKVYVAETDNYAEGFATADFTISKADIHPTVTIAGWTYGDAANDPTVDGNTGNGNVTYTYAPLADVPTYTEEVPTAAGNYLVKAIVAATTNYNDGEATANFTIAKANLNGVTIADIANQTYNAEEAIVPPAVTVTFNGNAVDAAEYTVGYSNNTNVGEAMVILTATGINFTEGSTATKTFQIVEAEATITANNQTKTYNGEAQVYTGATVTNGSVVVKYYESEADRTAGENELNVVKDAGIYYVKLEQGDANYTSEAKNATFTIEPKDLTVDMLWTDGAGDMIYNNDLPLVWDASTYGLRDVINEEDVDLVEGEDKDFTVSYSNNIKVGIATVTFTGKGNYKGTVTETFRILRELNIRFSDTNSWTSYYAEENLVKPEGLKAYIVTGVGDTDVTVEEISYIPQYVAVLLTYEEPVYAEGEFLAAAYDGTIQEFSDNLLWGTSAPTDVEEIEDGTVYVLYNNEFVKSVSGTIPANRGYLILGAAHSRSLGIVIDENATGIATVATAAAKANGLYYNLQGQRMAQPKKGLVIVDGKKVVIK